VKNVGSSFGDVPVQNLDALIQRRPGPRLNGVFALDAAEHAEAGAQQPVTRGRGARAGRPNRRSRRSIPRSRTGRASPVK
jgi:hypothetical protein